MALDMRLSPMEAEDFEERGGAISFPNLRHIRLFERVADCGSLSKAAGEIHISQPAATQAIAKLESQFGVGLINRGPSGISLTERGEIVLHRLRRALVMLRNGSEALARQSRLAKGLALDLIETHATMAHIRALSAFSETGSFAGAGRMLRQAESSVHRAARQFERIGSVPLFEGQNRTIRLTAAGRSLAVHASLFLREIISAFEELKEFEGSFSGRIRVGTLPLASTTVVPAAVARLGEAYPDAEFEIGDGDYESQSAALVAGRIDMLVGALRSDALAPGLVQRELFFDRLSILARSGHPLSRKPSVTAEDLTAYPWILSREGTPTRAIFDQLFQVSDRPAERGIVVSGSSVVVRGLLLNSDRLTILSPRQVAFEMKAGLITTLPFDLGQAGRAIGVTWRESWKPTRLQQAFIDCLGEVAGLA